jgi:hypothetical protein
MRKSRKPSASRKTSVVAAKPVQSGARVHAKLAEGGVRLSKEVAANFRAWFERNFVNPRAGRIGNMSYSRAGAFDDRPGDWTWYLDAYGRADGCAYYCAFACAGYVNDRGDFRRAVFGVTQ